jgi:hypothetical protein
VVRVYRCKEACNISEGNGFNASEKIQW